MVVPVVARSLVVGLAVTAAGALGFVGLTVVEPASQSAASVTYLVGATLIARHWHNRRFGMANSVTLMRLIGTSWIAALTLTRAVSFLDAGAAGDPWVVHRGIVAIVVIGTICLVLDNVDGRVARGLHEASSFGARFDMETDAAMLLFLSVAVAIVGAAGWWVLAIGLMRYAYVGVSWIVPALLIPIPPSTARKAVAAIQGVVLLLALALHLVPGVPEWLPGVPVVAALVLLCWSFGSCIVWQLQQSRESRRRRPV